MSEEFKPTEIDSHNVKVAKRVNSIKIGAERILKNRAICPLVWVSGLEDDKEAIIMHTMWICTTTGFGGESTVREFTVEAETRIDTIKSMFEAAMTIANAVTTAAFERRTDLPKHLRGPADDVFRHADHIHMVESVMIADDRP